MNEIEILRAALGQIQTIADSRDFSYPVRLGAILAICITRKPIDDLETTLGRLQAYQDKEDAWAKKSQSDPV